MISHSLMLITVTCELQRYPPFSLFFLQFVVLKEHEDPKNGSLPVADPNGPIVDAGLSSNLQPGE